MKWSSVSQNMAFAGPNISVPLINQQYITEIEIKKLLILSNSFENPFSSKYTHWETLLYRFKLNSLINPAVAISSS